MSHELYMDYFGQGLKSHGNLYLCHFLAHSSLTMTHKRLNLNTCVSKICQGMQLTKIKNNKKKRSKLKGTIHIKKHAVCKIMTTGRVKTIQTNGTRVPSPFELCNVSQQFLLRITIQFKQHTRQILMRRTSTFPNLLPHHIALLKRNCVL